MSCVRAAAGVIVRMSTVPTPPSIIAGTDGPGAGFGRNSSRLCARCRLMRIFRLSIPRQPRRTARPLAEKGGGCASHRPLARREDNQNPCSLRQPWPGNCAQSDTRPTGRCPGRHRPTGPTAATKNMRRRHRLRRQWPTPIPDRARHASGHSQQSDQKTYSSLRSQCISTEKPHRALVLQAQGLAPYRNAI